VSAASKRSRASSSTERWPGCGVVESPKFHASLVLESVFDDKAFSQQYKES
jgi:hypothetical protein